MKTKIISSLFLLTLVFSNGIYADNVETKKHIKPSFKACKGKSEGDEVTFVNKKGKTVKAICKYPKRLIAVPKRKLA